MPQMTTVFFRLRLAPTKTMTTTVLDDPYVTTAMMLTRLTSLQMMSIAAADVKTGLSAKRTRIGSDDKGEQEGDSFGGS